MKKQYYNFGMSHGNPIRYIEFLENINVDNISNVVLILYFNDIAIDKSSCVFYKKLKEKIIYYPKKCDEILTNNIQYLNNTFLKELDDLLENRSKIWLLLRESLASIHFFNKHYTRSSFAKYFNDKESEENFALIKDIKYLQNFFETKNINFKITYFPDVNYLKENNTNSLSWKKFISIAKENNIIIYNPWEYFLNNKESDNMSWSLTDMHPNCKAHGIMANYIIKNILQNG